DVAALILQRSGNVVDSRFRVLAQGALARPEADFSLRRGLVLIDVTYYLFHRGETGVGLSGGLLGHLGFISGVNGVLVGFVGLSRRQLNPLLRTRISVLDHLAIGRCKVVQFVYPVTNRGSLPLHILLARERIDLAPEAFMSVRLQCRFAAGSRVRRGIALVRRRSGGRRLVLGG